MGATTAQRVSRIAGTIEVEEEDGTAATYKVRKITGDQWEALIKAGLRDRTTGEPTAQETDATTRALLGNLVVDVTPGQFAAWPAEAQVLALSLACATVRQLMRDLGKDGAAPAAATT